MASSKLFIIFFLVAVFILPSIFAREIIVGDDYGWTINFDYQRWAEGKEFYVGDTLVFKYAPEEHNVLRVNGTGFQQCKAPTGIAALETGNDVITLSSPGKKWYICGIANHCEPGKMKLAITVLPQLESPAAAPSPTSSTPPSSATKSFASLYHLWILCIAGFVGMITI